jgi:hypothetical protein
MSAIAAAASTVGAAAAVQYLSPAARDWMNAHPAAALALIVLSCVPFGYLFSRALSTK